jgi:hypothetical protein
MARNLPETRLKRLQWLEARVAAWTANYDSIGLTQEQAVNISTATTAARSAFNAAELSRAQSKAKTIDWYEAVDDAAEKGAAAVNTIKAFAQSSGEPGVYSTAMVNPNDPPSPHGTPAVPENLKTEVLNTGGVEISWSGSLANRAYFEVFRRLPGQGAETLIASIGKTRFTDETIPAGQGRAWYAVRARRGELASDTTDVVEVRLGIPGEGDQSLALAA